MVIRYAQDADISQMLPLLDQLGYPMTAEMLVGRMRLYADQSRYAVLVAELDDNIVGLEALAFSDLFVNSGKRCRIEALVVDNAYRRRGIGRALMDYAERLAIRNGCIGVELTSGMRRGREGTHDFYESLGYVNEGAWAQVYLRKEL